MKQVRDKIAVKSIIGIVLLLAVFAGIVSIIGYRRFTEALLTQYSDGAFRIADAAGTIVDADRMDRYARSGGTTWEYTKAWESLDKLCNASDATFIYVIRPDRPDYGHITFLFSTMNRRSHYTMYEFGYVRETTNDEYRTKYRALYEGTEERELVIRDKGYIETDPHITAMIPLRDQNGQTQAILCVQRQMDELAEARRAYLRKVTLVLCVLSLLVIVGQGVYLHRVLLRPLRQITEEASRFSRENVAAEQKLRETIPNRDEIGLLAGSIDRMEEQIQSYMKDLTRITAEKERISTELSLATQIQAGMLPSIFPPFPNRREFALFASMDPAKEVGGDFYDFFLIDDDHLCIVMADVSGKGVPAALFMMASKIILASCAMLGRSAAEILTKTNEAVCSNNQQEMFVTVWLGILEISTGRLTAANAGHEYPALRRASGEFELYKDRHGLVIGAMDGARYKEYQLQLEPGDKLFVYTDGVPEATDGANRMFGAARMLQALNTARDAAPEEIVKTVRAAVDGFVRDAEQFDDITMLCMEYRGNQNV